MHGLLHLVGDVAISDVDHGDGRTWGREVVEEGREVVQEGRGYGRGGV
jgi:hypothetical protein